MNDVIRNFSQVTLSQDPTGVLALQKSDGTRIVDVRPLRLFPLSDPLHWIVLLDANGEELDCVEEPLALDQNSQRLLTEELARREFVPHIRRILSVSGNSEPCRWEVETDRGMTTFVLNHENDIRRLSQHSILIVDAHGIRYVIPDDRQLDTTSRRVVEWYV